MNNMDEKVKEPLSLEPAPGADFQPAEMLRITTLEQLKAISDPLRMDILEIVADEALTVKQIAEKLNQPATKLYYHVSELEDAGFVKLVGTRVKSGIIEKYYRIAAESMHVDRSLLNADEALTVKQMADKLGQPATKLYYHVSELEDAGFVKLVGTRVKSGIIEKYYRIAAESMQVDRSLLNNDEGMEESLSALIDTVFDTTIADLRRSFHAGLLKPTGDTAGPESKLMMLSHDLCRLRQEDIPTFIEKFKSLLEEMNPKTEGEGMVTYGCTIAFYPHAAPGEGLSGKE